MAQFPHDPLLTRFAREQSLNRLGAVGTRIAPLLLSETGITGEYAKWGQPLDMGEVDVKRAPGAEVKRKAGRQFTMEAFRLNDHTVDVPVPFEYDMGLYNARVLNRVQKGIEEAVTMIQTRHEQDVHDLIWRTSEANFKTLYTNAHVIDPANGKWDTETGQIKRDVNTLKRRIMRDTGRKPNKMLIPAASWDILSAVNNELRAVLPDNALRSQNLDVVARYLDLEEIIIPEFLKNTANSGTTKSMTEFYTTDAVLLFFSDPAPSDATNALAYTIYADQPESPFFGAEAPYNRTFKTYDARASAMYEAKLVDNLCGGVIWDVLT